MRDERLDAAEQIKEAYRRRDAAGKNALYSPFDAASLYMGQQREKAILRTLKGRLGDDNPLKGKKILEVGCGEGAVLRDFVKYGARPEDCYGMDLIGDRIKMARHINPNMNLTAGNAEALPFADGVFDIVILFTVLTSVPDSDMKRNLAGEIQRVLKGGGFVLYYDFMFDNHRNPDVKGVRKGEVSQLFYGCRTRLRRTTLAPPLTRRLAPASTIFCQLLEKLPPLCTHYLGTIEKR